GREEGVAIARVFPGTSAADAGLQEGDRIVVWNGEKVAKIEDWMPMLASHEPGDVIDVIIIRDGKEMTLPMTLKARESRSE
ncbi:MAG: PDZ domain-containing protein, partial [Phycisphaerales bacterium]|nr:PDZ domain-containing protein [Phycisphaerales bacterium]